MQLTSVLATGAAAAQCGGINVRSNAVWVTVSGSAAWACPAPNSCAWPQLSGGLQRWLGGPLAFLLRADTCILRCASPRCQCRPEEVSYDRIVSLRSLIADKDMQPQLCVGEPSIKGAVRCATADLFWAGLSWRCAVLILACAALWSQCCRSLSASCRSRCPALHPPFPPLPLPHVQTRKTCLCRLS